MPSLLTALRDHLVAQSIVRKPSVAGSAPPLWLEPQLGTPGPGEGNNPVEVGSDLVLGAFLTGGFAPPPYGSFLRKPIVDIRFRGRSPQNIETTELAITKALIDRRDFTMGGLYVVECEQWRPLQRLGSDEQGFEYVSAYWFELIRA
jgi:hypothetical protein